MTLSAHQHIVDKLKFYHAHPQVRGMIQSELGDQSSGPLVFHLRTEINRLARPSKRPFRIEQTIPNIDAIYHEHDGAVHHFDQITFAEFTKTLEKYNNMYTVGVEEHMHAFLQENKEAIIHSQTIQSLEITAVDISESIYRKEERMHLGVRGLAYKLHRKPSDADNLSDLVIAGRECAIVTQNISESGLSLKSEAASAAGEWWLIRLSGLEQDFVFGQPYVLYQCVKSEIQKSAEDMEHRWALKKVEHVQHAEFNIFLKRLIFANRGRYKVDLENVERSVYHHATEQFITNRAEGFCAFLTKDGTTPFVFGNANGRHLFQRFEYENSSVLPALIHKDKLVETGESGFVFWAMIRQSKGSFFSAPLTNDPNSRLFFQYALSRDDAHFFQVHCSTLQDNSEAYRSHSLPHLGEMSKKIERLRRLTDHYADCTREAVDQLTHAIHFQPLSRATLASFMDPRPSITPEQQKGLSVYSVRNARRLNIRYVVARSRELRKEDRFSLNTQVSIQSDLGVFHGETIDISESGCCLRTSDARASLQDQIVTIHFGHLPKIGSHSATGRYKVLSDKQGVLRLYSAAEHRNAAQVYMSLYLDKHFNQLEPVQETDRAGHVMLGLERALRHLRNSTIPQTSGLILRHQNMAYPARLNVSKRNQDPIFQCHPTAPNEPDPRLKSIFCHLDIQKQLGNDFRKIDADTPYCRHILLIAISKDPGVTPWVRIADEGEWAPAKLKILVSMLKKKRLTPLLYQLDVTRKTRVFDRYYREELSYIESVASHRSQKIYDFIKNAMGTITFTPLNGLIEYE